MAIQWYTMLHDGFRKKKLVKAFPGGERGWGKEIHTMKNESKYYPISYHMKWSEKSYKNIPEKGKWKTVAQKGSSDLRDIIPKGAKKTSERYITWANPENFK